MDRRYAIGDLTRDGDDIVEVVSPTDDIRPGYTEVTANGTREAYLVATETLGDDDDPVCAYCDQPITGAPVTDDGQAFWLSPPDMDVWCSETCHDNHAERLSATL
jgi:hypothetical protein